MSVIEKFLSVQALSEHLSYSLSAACRQFTMGGDDLTLDIQCDAFYADEVIKSFRSADTERLFRRERVRRFEAIERSAQRKLEMLNAAKELRDLAAVQGNRLEKLRGEREGQHSIRINDRWRVCFVWQDGDASDVEIADYH
jgi:proteic killer suppression protein